MNNNYGRPVHIGDLDRRITEENRRLRENAIASYAANDEELTIIYQCGTWAVTDYGMESLTTYYPIPVARLWNDRLALHMAEKSWVIMSDFLPCLAQAQQHHQLERTRRNDRDISPQLRFRIFKRDGYRCQMCGRSAGDELTLEIDHRVPRSKGGGNEPSNLWVLCWDCNRGKSNEDL